MQRKCQKESARLRSVYSYGVEGVTADSSEAYESMCFAARSLRQHCAIHVFVCGLKLSKSS